MASHRDVIAELNATPLSEHIFGLMAAEDVAPVDGLSVIALLAWAADHHYSNKCTGELELGAAVIAEAQDPEGFYDNLADERILDAESLSEASAVLVSRLSDLLDDRSIPPARGWG